jgi:hypothetical protein
MEHYFLKRNRSLDLDDNTTNTSGSVLRLKQANVTGGVPKPSSQYQREIDLDELPYDLVDRKRITEYTKNPKKQDDIRRSDKKSQAHLHVVL